MSFSAHGSTLRVVMNRFVVLGACLLVVAFVLADSALAQQPTLKEMVGGTAKEKKVTEQPEQKPEQKTAQAVVPDDEFDRGTPRGSVAGFLKATREWNYERAAEYLDLRRLPRGLDKSKGPLLARELKIVLDRTLWIDLDALSTDPQGHLDDGLPTYRDRVGRIETAEKPVTILLQRVPRGDGVRIWKVSTVTVARIPALYEQFGYGLIGDFLPAAFLDLQILGLQAWWWAAILLVGVFAFLAALVVTKAVALPLRRKVTKLTTPLERILAGPARLLLFIIIARVTLNLLGPTPVMRALMSTYTIPTIAVAWGAMCLFDIFGIGLAERLRRRGRGDLTVLLPPLANATKVAAALIAGIVWLHNVGVNVTTLVAGLGIGGLAVALAAQKPIENLIGAVTLYTSQPVRVGDFCRFGDKIGTVEEIGLRATRVRTLDRTVVSVANAEFVNLQLDNFSKREKVWYHPRIRLPYETTPNQIRYILVEIRKMLYAHPKVDPDPARIRFAGFGEYSVDLDVFAYVDVTDYGQYLEIAEDLNLRIMDIVAQAGSRLAVPSQTMYLERADKLDDQLAQAAETHVKEWREHNALYLPSFPQEKIAELAGSLDYPPTGSPGAATRT